MTYFGGMLIVFIHSSLVFKVLTHPFIYTGGSEMARTLATIWLRWFWTCSKSKMLSLLSLNAQSTMLLGTSTEILVNFVTSVSNTTFRRFSIISFAGIRCPCLAIGFVGLMQINPVPLNRLLTLPRTFGFNKVFLATRRSSCILVAVILSGVASGAVAMLTEMSAFVVPGSNTRPVLGWPRSNFDFGNMQKIFLFVKLVQERLLTTSLSAMWNAACVMKPMMRTCKLVLLMISTESLKAERRLTFPAAYRWAIQWTGKKAFVIKFGLVLFSISMQQVTMCGWVFRRVRLQKWPICL